MEKLLEFLRNERLNKCLKQAYLAEKLGVDESTISRWESGQTVMTRWIECYLGEVADRKHPLDRYYQGHIRYEAGSCWAYPNLGMTSGGLKSLSVANGLIKIPGNSDRLERGTLVKVLPFTR